MNKYQEALNVYKTLEGFKQGVMIPCDPMIFYAAEKTLQELVNKATPKKPIKLKLDYMEAYVCPNCRHTYEGSSYCRFCGQLFDRSENEKS